jgi:hypothetical protein
LSVVVLVRMRVPSEQAAAQDQPARNAL